MTIAAQMPPAAVLEPVLERVAGREPGTLAAVTLPIAPIDALALYAAAGEAASLWLQPASGLALVGIGEAWAARPGDGARFASVSAAWKALLETAHLESTDAPADVGPLLLGGFAFDDADPSSAVWGGFERGCMILPSLLVTNTSHGSWLTLSWLGGGDGDEAVDALVETWGHIVARTRARVPDPPVPTLRLVGQQPGPVAWRDSVARLAGAVGRGRLDKAVLARQVSLQAGTDIDPSDVLRRLQVSAPESTLFALSRGRRTFVGATPERLVRLRGRELSTMAMAGSTRRAADAATDDALATELMESDKEREEHAVVVAMLREALAPVAEELAIATRPEVARLRHVQHLVTPISGRLRADADVLTLVERLHPTPAVGGMPRELALELIAEEEPIERGWYAGPLGWMDRHGDGEFVVALRSGVVRGREATLFAGCGIVADSDPEREWDESASKLLALGSALGVIEP